jgi:hypothetical protein
MDGYEMSYLVLVAIEDRQAHISVSDAFGRVLTLELLSEVLESMKPHLKAKLTGGIP